MKNDAKIEQIYFYTLHFDLKYYAQLDNHLVH